MTLYVSNVFCVGNPAHLGCRSRIFFSVSGYGQIGFCLFKVREVSPHLPHGSSLRFMAVIGKKYGNNLSSVLECMVIEKIWQSTELIVIVRHWTRPVFEEYGFRL